MLTDEDIELLELIKQLTPEQRTACTDFFRVIIPDPTSLQRVPVEKPCYSHKAQVALV